MSASPKGMGLYIRALRASPRKDPKKMAQHFADHHIKWAAIGGPWFDVDKETGRPRKIWMNRPFEVKRLAEELSLAGIKPHVWGYPWHDRIEQFIECIDACLDGTIVGVLPDPELGLKKHAKEARELFLGLRDLNTYLMLGMTSYGFPDGHETFPWDEWAEPGVEGDWSQDVEYGSPQLYDETPKRIKAGINQWIERGFDAVAPSFGTFKIVLNNGKRTFPLLSKDELITHLDDFIDSGHDIDALIGWSENLIRDECWPVIAEYAEMLEPPQF